MFQNINGKEEISNMNINIELRNFIEDYSSHIIISLSNTFKYNSNFLFKRGSASKIRDNFDINHLDKIVENICYDLISTGKSYIYYKIEDSKLIITNKKINNCKFIKLKIPKNIIKNWKKTYKMFSYLDYSNALRQSTDDISLTNNLINANSIAQLEIDKRCNPFYASQHGIFDYYSEWYCVYREANKKLFQRKLLDYILDKINYILYKELKLEHDDILLFDGFSQDELYDIITDLKNYKTSLGKISSRLYQRK